MCDYSYIAYICRVFKACKSMNRKHCLIVIFLLMCGLAVNGQVDDEVDPDLVPHEETWRRGEISLSFTPASGGPKWLWVKNTAGENVKVGDRYVRVDKKTLDRLSRNEAATYWYDIQAAGGGSRYVAKAQTIQNSLGVTVSHLTTGDFVHKGVWLPGEIGPEFESPTFHVNDFGLGIVYSRQLYAVNRHRLTLEINPTYRQMYYTMEAPRYAVTMPDKDSDGAEYERLVNVSNYKESYLTHSLAVPLAARYDFFVFKYLSLFASVGLENLFVLSGNGKAEFDALYAGQYGPELFNVLIDQNGYYDFGTFQGLTIERKDENAFRYSLSGTFSVGLQVFIGPNLSIEIAGIYHRMLYSTPSDSQGAPFCLSSSSNNYQSMMSLLPSVCKDRLGGDVKVRLNF